MTQGFWTTDDFEVFSIEGLEYRMNALQTKDSTEVRTNRSTCVSLLIFSGNR